VASKPTGTIRLAVDAISLYWATTYTLYTQTYRERVISGFSLGVN
jgi:hypothetical protein